jgi:hypothetical protein
MMRRCRYKGWRREFFPPKPNDYFCSWDCHQAHFDDNDYQGYRRSSDQSYDRGYNDAWQSQRPADLTIPRGIWESTLLLCHPDKYA